MNKNIIFLLLILIILIMYPYHEQYELFSSNQIPLIMYKTGPQFSPSKNMLKLFENNKKNLNVKIIYFNNQDCKQFMIKMGGKYLKAYNSLIPNAYKADLWRYSVLYMNGGVYGDLTQNFIKQYDINENNTNQNDIDMVLVKDIDRTNIQISFMATIKKNGFFKYLIDNVSSDILNKKKGNNPLDITGPSACGRHFLIFFNLKEIPNGINLLKGLDNKYYLTKINIHQYPNSFYNINNNTKIAITKTAWHNNMIQKEGKQQKYWNLYSQNKIFK